LLLCVPGTAERPLCREELDKPSMSDLLSVVL